jgi:hypothetical protein
MMKSINDVNLAKLNGGGNCVASSSVLALVGFFALAVVASVATAGVATVAVVTVAYGAATAVNAYNCA